MADPPYLGVIEGFYGRAWSHAARIAYATHLGHLGLNSYLYCPKSDVFLRKRWRECWPLAQRKEIEELAAVYSENELDFGLGLSPFELYRNYDARSKQALKDKVRYLYSIGAPTLAILFDDMPGDMPDLASRQAEIVADVRSWVPQLRLIVCPSYYSFDAALEKHFGPIPLNYWAQLGRELNAEVELFWTGNRVCSDAITAADIDQINGDLGRKVTLWDNYPVNDGAQRSNHVYCAALAHRDPSISNKVMGHYCNPMNQPQLSLLALAGLPELYGRETPGLATYLQEVFTRETFEQLQVDAHEFETLGLSGMGKRRCRELALLYSGLGGDVAHEISQWLQEEYAFDPACLTD
ncbi:MAG: beta-N-acetylglucosaminidase domain-containing protein [Halioglobus sp.]